MTRQSRRLRESERPVSDAEAAAGARQRLEIQIRKERVAYYAQCAEQGGALFPNRRPKE